MNGGAATVFLVLNISHQICTSGLGTKLCSTLTLSWRGGLKAECRGCKGFECSISQTRPF